ncbi:hypothetical protein PsorP6_010765 [Peronosclerospora sorghi]|uniref:Uncharacterized protein n=1 Tax=Peronosclerospora sorghi TaxID=230839 RepID=A0ACC0VWW7_9STRA|nr:hypothetical protein PsorP6_010765 [Peronosclerospora sorghi]
MSLSTLSSLLLPGDAAEDTDDWSIVSSKLSSLRLSTMEELRTVETALDAVPCSSMSFAVEDHDVIRAYKELKRLDHGLSDAEEHFQELKSILSPRLMTLQRLQYQAKYLETAVQVEKLSHIVKTKAIEATQDALDTFHSLKALVISIPMAYTVLRNKATRRVDSLWMELRCSAFEKLRVALEKMNWPDPLKTQQEWSDKESELNDVSKAFAFLLTLQLQSEQASATTELWAINCVLEPLDQRFRYHFERKESAINRLAKPEWYLSHIHEQLSAHTRFLGQTLTPSLHRYRQKIHCWDAQILLLRGLVEAVGRKLTHDMPTLIAHPPLLCHTLDEILLFEQLIDEDFGYDSWASTHRRAYPRCIDAFISTNDVMFAWMNVDVEYTKRLLPSILEADESWQLEHEVYKRMVNSSDLELIPPAALHFVSLLDFVSQRFTYMETQEHRYVYVMQVHMPLLRRFGAFCEARGRQLIDSLTKQQDVHVWSEVFVVVNALEHVVETLTAWEQSSVFLELARKVAQCETTRDHVLQMHVAYSKQVFARVSAAVLASEEATAVQHALAGPGAMIGPSAALSAAYSAGSKTMRNLFRRAEEPDAENQVDDQLFPAAANCSTEELLEQEPRDDPATLFSHTIFERQIEELKSLTTTLLEGAKTTLVRTVERPMGVYCSR